MKTNRTVHVFVDEYSEFFGNVDDDLNEELRKIKGVPNATYVINGDKVFVFAKLIQKVKEHRQRQARIPLDELARDLVPLATVSAEEAVKQWSVIPEPYTLDADNNKYIIRHKPFNAQIPGIFSTKESAEKVLRTLLIGGIHKGVGDFTYRGQPLILIERLDVSELPPRPTIEVTGIESAQFAHSHLFHCDFDEGFSPVSHNLFTQVKELESTWQDDSARASHHAYDRSQELWQRIAEFPLHLLNDMNVEVPEYDVDDILQLRSLYPELSMLTDGSLYDQYDTYQRDCWYINGWTANREDAFLFFLLGMLTNRQYEGETAKTVGGMVAYTLLRGETIQNALGYGVAWKRYNDGICSLAYRIANAMRYLSKDKKTTDLRGSAIWTMMDLFRLGWKFNAKSMTANQDVAPILDKADDLKAIK